MRAETTDLLVRFYHKCIAWIMSKVCLAETIVERNAGSCDGEPVIGADLAQLLDNEVGRQRNLRKAHAEGRKRILDGTDDRRRPR